MAAAMMYDFNVKVLLTVNHLKYFMIAFWKLNILSLLTDIVDQWNNA